MTSRTYLRVSLALFAVVGFLFLVIASSNASDEVTPIGCVEVDLEWSGNTPLISEITYRDEGVRTATVGNFLWIQFNSDGSADSLNNVASVEIPDGSITAAACISEHDIESADFTAESIQSAVVAVPVDKALKAETVKVWFEEWIKVAQGWLIK